MKVLISLLFTFMISTVCMANTETNTMRTPTGQLLTIGDSFAKMVERLPQSPLSMSTYPWQDGKKTYTANVYVYEIESSIYTITIVKNKIRKIEWFSTNI